MDGILAVAGDPLIDGKCDKRDIVPYRKQPAEQNQESGAVLAPAQCDSDPVSGGDQVVLLNGPEDTLFDI
jgi:hypothetical protein